MIAAIYARKSPVQNGGGERTTSVTRQVEHARAYADRKGWTVAGDQIYLDDRISGAEFENRPGYMRLLNALKPRAPFEVLIVSELSRLGREQFETNYALKQLSQAGVRVYSHLEDREVLLDTPTDKFLMSAVSFAAEVERDKARQRTYDAMLRKARAGHVTGGPRHRRARVRLRQHRDPGTVRSEDARRTADQRGGSGGGPADFRAVRGRRGPERDREAAQRRRGADAAGTAGAAERVGALVGT